MIQGGICARSTKVKAYIVNALSGVSNCGEVTPTHLASLTGTMTLSAQGATTLQAGDLAGLSQLTGLDLANRNIASLPGDVFSDLAKLTTLNLSGNSLTELPAGVFVGLSSLSSLDLSSNSGAPFTLPLTLRDGGSGGVHVYLEHGAPSALNIPLQATGGSLSASSVTVAAGETISPSVTFTADSSGDAMTVSFGGTLPSAGTGVQLGAGASLTFADDGICARTAQVRDVILARLGESDCSAVTRTELAGIGGTLSLSNKGIASLRYGDLNGLSSLARLYLSSNELTSLPAGVFSGLRNLEYLYLDRNELTSLPDGVFSGLSSLKELNLAGNGLMILPAGVFSGLSSLRSLYLNDNALTSLPTGVFSGLSNLTWLLLYRNDLRSLPSGVFSGLSSLTRLYLSSNELTSLPSGVFSGLGSLQQLFLESNALTSLPSGVFSGLSGLRRLQMYGNGLRNLPSGVFSGLSSLQFLSLGDNALTSLPDGVFSGLSSLTQLSLGNNDLTSLPEGVFSGLSSLEDLWLYNTALTSLPEGVFSGLSSLEGLRLYNNDLTSLPEGVFSGLRGLEVVRLSGNSGAPFQVALSLEVDSATSTISVLAPLGAPEALAIPLSFSGGTVAGSTTATVTIPKGATTSSTVTVDFAAAEGVVTVSFGTLPALTAYEVIPQASGIDGLTLVSGDPVSFESGICGHTAQVQVAIKAKLDNKACRLITNTDLAGINGTLSLNSKSITSLKAGDFSGLANLEGLELRDNQLTNLPTGIFSDLDSLTGLDLGGNQLASVSGSGLDGVTSLQVLRLNGNSITNLPASLLSNLTDLTELNLSGNSLAELPVGVFVGLSSLSSVDLSGNSGTPFTLPLTFREDGTGLHVYLAHGAPSALSIPLQATGGSLSATNVTIAVGETISQSVTFTADSSGDAMTVSFGGTLPSAGTGVQLGAGEPLTLVDGICTRTPLVQDAILEKLGQSDCSTVTRAQLAGISGLSQSKRGIVSLKYEDFNGLSSLRSLYLYNTALTSLPEGVFSGLSSLRSLSLSSDGLTSLPEGVFSGLSSLRSLSLSSDGLKSLPEGVFSGLSSLRSLSLSSDGLKSLPEGVFSGLSSLQTLDLSANDLTSLPEGVFSGLSSLEVLWLYNNDLTSLPEGVFSGLSSLEVLWLYNNDLTSLPEGVFSGLSSLEVLWLYNNDLTSLPEGVFSGLSSLEVLWLYNNDLTSLPEGVFSGLSNLEGLLLYNNDLTSLPEGVFSGLNSLSGLYLDSNALTSLPEGVFSGLISLLTLRLSGNSGAPFQVALSLESDPATRTIRILVPLGAPEDLAIPLSFSGGTVAGSATATVTIPTGVTKSPPVAVDFADTTGTATVSFGALPALTPYSSSTGGINGLTLVAGDDLTFVVNAGSFSQNICERTAQVRAAIRAKLANTACTNVTDLHLAGISGTLSLNSQSIASLKAGDLRGLTSLHGLDLGDNQLTSLPTGIFSDLASLNSLDLGGNDLASLSTGIFSDLDSLTSLDLGGNDLASLSGSGLDGLTSLQVLKLEGNSLTSFPDEIFNSPRSLTTLDLSGNPGAPFTLTFTPIAGDFNTVRVQMSASAWATLTVRLGSSNGGQLSGSRVIVAPGATLSTAVTFTPGSDPNRVSKVGIGTLPTLPASFTGIALAEGPSLTMVQGGICSRSTKVRAAIVNALSAVSDCGAVTATHLASLTGTLTFGASGATTLQAGDFAGLSELTGLNLANRNIASLPQDLFSELAKLTTLNLSGNSLTELPAGVFAGLSSLSSLDLSGNSGVPFTLPLVLREDGGGGVRVYLGHGAPSALNIPLQVTGGSLSASSVVIAAGETVSQSVTFTADGSGDTMSVSFGGTLPSAGTGVQLGAGGPLTFADNGICARTPQVRDAILARLGESDCSAVTRTALVGIDGTLNLSSMGITSLRYEDFNGLSSLIELYLSGNELTSLPEGVFSGLSSLRSLSLSNTVLTSLPEGVFSGLNNLQYLYLSGNELTSLPEGVFSGLSSLEYLGLTHTALTSLPEGVFSGLSSLENLYLSRNGLTSLSEGVFSGLSSLEDLGLSDNELRSLPSGVFSGLNNLEELWLSRNGLTSLPEGVFSGLSSLTNLALLNNELTSLPEGVFSGLSSLTLLRLSGNPGASFQVELSLEVDSVTSTIRILAPLGAPEDLAIPLSFSGGTVSGSNTATVTISAGGTASSSVTVDSVADEGIVTVSFGTLPALTPYSYSFPSHSGIRGLVLVPGDAESFSPGICGRTAQVRTAIKAKLGNKACGLVTDTDLAGISGILSLNSESIASLQADDFSGLTSLEGLELRGNTLTSLPTGILSDLDSLTSLDLGGNQLASVSGSGLDGLTSLQVLRLNGNSFTTLPANLLSNLTGLTELNLSGNDLSNLPTSLLTGLTSLADLDLSGNQLTSLSGSVFGTLTSLTELKLNNNQLASLPANLLSALTSLTELKLNNNQLSELPDGLFSGLTSLIAGDLDFRDNKTALALPMVLDYQRSSQSQGSLSVGLAIGAPVALSIPLRVAAGDASLSANTVTLAAGGVSSSSITVTRGAGNADITLSFGTLPVLTDTGLTLQQGASVILSVPVFATASLPDRTQLEDTALPAVQFGEASGLDTPLTHVLSATTSTSGVTLTNGLPAGLSFDTATRRLTGTPTTPGVYALTYTSTDSDGDTATQTLMLTVVADTAPSFGGGTVAQQDYKQFAAISNLTLPAATGGNGAPVYSLSATTSDGTLADNLPAGLDFDADTRTLSGTPTAAGTYAMVYSASDEDDDSVSLSFQLVVDSVPTLGNAFIGNHTYVKDQAIGDLQLPQAEGGTGAVSYSLTGTTTDGTLASNLPAGLAFTASTRTLSGTPTAAGTYSMTYTATDTDSDSSARTFELAVVAFVPVCDRTAQVSDALVARLKSDGTLSSSNSCAQVTDSMLSALAGTLSLSNPSPKLTALVASDFSGLSSLEVLDLSDNSLTASGLPGNVFSSLGSLTELNLADNALSATLSANLLAGLGTLQELSLAGNSLTASHFPGTLFDNTALLEELDLSSNSLSGGLPSSLLSALPDTLTSLALRNASLPGLPAGFFTGLPALTTVDLTGNTVALTLQLHYLGNDKIQARLPEGAPWPLTVSVSGASGSGTQVSPGSISLTQGETASAELQVSGYPATISLGSLPSVPASHSPTGLTLVAGGSLTLTVPTFSVSVADRLHTAGVNLAMQLPAATSGTDSIGYSLSVSTDNGTLGDGDLPAGLSLTSSSRTLSGAPTAAGTYAVTWTATDADGDRVELTFNLVVEVDRTPYFAQSVSIGEQVWPPDADITAAPSGGVSAPCTLGGDPLSPCQLPAAEGGNGSLRYSLSATVPDDRNGELRNGLPTGLAFAAGTRQLSGAPTAVGTYSMTYSASDKEGDAASLSFEIVVDGIPVFSSTQNDLSLSTGVRLTALTLPTSTGGNLPLTYSLTAEVPQGESGRLEDSLPAGLQFAPNTRLLTGAATVIGTYQLTYSVTDNNGSSPAPIRFTIRVRLGVDVCNRRAVTAAIVVAGGEPCGTIDSSELAAITSLTVKSDKAVTLQPEFFTGLPALTTLNLDGVTSNTLEGKLGAGLLSGLPNLRELSLSGIGLDRLPVESFAGLVALEELDLSDNDLTTLGDAATSASGGAGPENLVFDGLAELRTLNLSGNDLQTLPDSLLGGLEKLEDLDLSGNPGAPFEFRVDLMKLSERPDGFIEVTAATAAERSLPLPVPVTLEVRSDGIDDTLEELEVPATGAAGGIQPLEVSNTRNSVRIIRLRFGAGDTGWSGEYKAFAGVRLVAGEALILDAYPDLSGTAVASRSYVQNTPIEPWQLPEAPVVPSGVSPESIPLTYSLSATTDDPDLTLAANLPAGLVFNAATRTLTGTPMEVGAYRMTYSVVDDDGDAASLQFEVTVGGQEALYRQLHAQILSQYALTIATEAGRAVAERVDRLAQGQAPRFATNADGSEFEIPLRSRGGNWSLWRRDNGNDLSWKSASTWSWDGNITSWQMGADRYAGDSSWLAGFMMQNAEGEFDYSGGSGLGANLSGTYAVPVRSSHLYAGWAPRGKRGTSWVSVWGMAGLGSGEVSLGQRQASVNLRSDADISMSHFGVAITPVRLGNGLRVQLRAETVQTTVDLGDAATSAGGDAMSIDASRQRALLEVSLPDLLKGEGQLKLSSEFGSRADDSGVDAASDLAVGMPDGSGTEIGVKLRYISSYMTLELGTRSLSVDAGEAGDEFEESGWYLSFNLTSRPGARGLALSLKPSRGNTSSGMDRLWEDDQLPGVGAVGRGAGAGKGRMNAELSYGFGLSGGGSAVLSPYSKISAVEGSAHSGAFGVRLKLGKAFDLNLEHSDQYGAEAQDGRGKFRLGGTLRL